MRSNGIGMMGAGLCCGGGVIGGVGGGTGNWGGAFGGGCGLLFGLCGGAMHFLQLADKAKQYAEGKIEHPNSAAAPAGENAV